MQDPRVAGSSWNPRDLGAMGIVVYGVVLILEALVGVTDQLLLVEMVGENPLAWTFLSLALSGFAGLLFCVFAKPIASWFLPATPSVRAPGLEGLLAAGLVLVAVACVSSSSGRSEGVLPVEGGERGAPVEADIASRDAVLGSDNLEEYVQMRAVAAEFASLNDLSSIPADCRALAYVDGQFPFEDSWVETIVRRFPGLEFLDLGDCRRVTDEGIRHVSRLSSLQLLRVNFATRVTESGAAHLAGLNQLRYLDIDYLPGVTNDAGIRQISKIEALECLSIRRHAGGGCTEAAIPSLESMRSMKLLMITHGHPLARSESGSAGLRSLGYTVAIVPDMPVNVAYVYDSEYLRKHGVVRGNRPHSP